jgi:predicted ATPase/class 3 adenylate cyclase
MPAPAAARNITAVCRRPRTVIEPASEVTYLFSDVEGSTRLWETEPDRIAPALARHDRLARAIVESHGGRVVKMTGDGLHAAFADPAAAVAAVIEMQLAIARPQEADVLPLAVRCGLHLGADQQRDGDYFGPAVNRAARVMAAAHGGQVLLSQAVAERVRQRLPDGVSLRDLGLARLRDLTGAEQLFQLVHPQLRSDFPPLRSLASTPNNLPQQVNSFIGRVRELDEVRAMLGYPSVRLLTLLGMGGLGKSRLSLQAAAEVLDDYPDGVWFVELAPLSDPRSVAQAVASVLGVKEEAGGAVLDALLRYLRDKSLLIVLDNCEHVVQACAELAHRVLQTAPRVKLLASSRDALQTAGETVIHVPPLAAPDAGATITPAALAQIDAVRLFIDRATAAQPAFRVTEKNAAAVAAICRRLDGIPLALELAAARTRALPAETIAARLDDRFKLLVTGDRTVLPRQRTLRALIDWSYDLLSGPERLLFARLSVFAGGWTLEAAEAVGAGDGIDAAEVLDLQTSLVEKSLVMVDLDSGRHRMLDTVRQYAHERLIETGGVAAARERHLGYFLAFVEQAKPQLFGPEQGSWMARLDLERENILAAHQWCDSSPAGADSGIRLVFALKFYWLNRGLLQQGYSMAVQAIRRPAAQASRASYGRGLVDAGIIGCFMGRYAEAREFLAAGLQIAREVNDVARQVAVLQLLGVAEFSLGNAPQALEHCREAEQLARAAGNDRMKAGALTARAQLLRAVGELDEATALYEEALQLSRQLGDEESVAVGLLNLAMVAVLRRQPRPARALLQEVAQIASHIGSKAAGQSLIEVCAALCEADGEVETAALLVGAAEGQQARSGLHRDPADQLFVRELLDRLRGRLGGRAAALEAQGRELDYDAALARAVDWLAQGRPDVMDAAVTA